MIWTLRYWKNSLLELQNKTVLQIIKIKQKRYTLIYYRYILIELTTSDASMTWY